MSPEIGHLDELSFAMSAAVRLLSGVQPHVRFQVMIPSESLVTNLAFERFFPGVCPFVILQHVFVSERPIADLTGEHFVSRSGCPVEISTV